MCGLNSHIRGIANDSVKTTGCENVTKSILPGVPVERPDAFALLGSKGFVLFDVWTNERIATPDVVLQFRQDLMLGRQHAFLSLEGFQVETHHCYFNSLLIVIHAVQDLLDDSCFCVEGYTLSTVNVVG